MKRPAVKWMILGSAVLAVLVAVAVAAGALHGTGRKAKTESGSYFLWADDGDTGETSAAPEFAPEPDGTGTPDGTDETDGSTFGETENGNGEDGAGGKPAAYESRGATGSAGGTETQEANPSRAGQSAAGKTAPGNISSKKPAAKKPSSAEIPTSSGKAAVSSAKNSGTAGGLTQTSSGKPASGGAGSAQKTSSGAHRHVYVGQTCTTPGTCSCGKTAAALGHDFSPATCTAPKTCARCKLTEGKALGHSYKSGKCVRCGEPGGPLTLAEAKWFHNDLTDEQNAMALNWAKRAAKQALARGKTDLEIIRDAFHTVKSVGNGVYNCDESSYSEAYDFVSGRRVNNRTQVRTFGLILDVLGYPWTYINENQYTHQWIELTLNGELYYADFEIGGVNPGRNPFRDFLGM